MILEIKQVENPEETKFFKVVGSDGVQYATIVWDDEYGIYAPLWHANFEKLTARQMAWLETFRAHINKIAE